MDDYQETLRRLAIPDTGFIERLLRDPGENAARSRIDARAFALVRIAALVTADATTASFAAACQDALQAEVTPEEIVGTLIAVLPLIGAARRRRRGAEPRAGARVRRRCGARGVPRPRGADRRGVTDGEFIPPG